MGGDGDILKASHKLISCLVVFAVINGAVLWLTVSIVLFLAALFSIRFTTMISWGKHGD